VTFVPPEKDNSFEFIVGLATDNSEDLVRSDNTRLFRSRPFKVTAEVRKSSGHLEWKNIDAAKLNKEFGADEIQAHIYSRNVTRRSVWRRAAVTPPVYISP
jgi:hypothetical protein